MSSSSTSSSAAAASLRLIFAGPRGRLLTGLLAAEFGAAVQTVAEAAVLPLASQELNGARLYGATIAGPTLTAILLILLGPVITARLTPRRALGISTVVYLAGVLLAALAPVMGFVFAGRLLLGAAAGLLGGFGLTAIGALYDDEIRPRVLGLFSAVWLLPSVLGPLLNSTVAVLAGWRWAMAWPALVVVAARLAIGRRATLLPRPETPARPPLGGGLLVLAGLILASASALLTGALRPVAWGVGLAAALGGAAMVVWSLTSHHRRRCLILAVFAGLCTAYFGSEGLLPLSVITVTHGGVVGASIAYAAGATAWSLTGISLLGTRMKWLAPLVGGVAITVAVVILAVTTLTQTTGAAGLVLSITAWAVAGAGIGLAYRTLSAAAFNNSPPSAAPALGAAVAFTETTTVALAALIGGGFYSLTSHTLPVSTSIGLGYVLTCVVALAALIGAAMLYRKQSAARSVTEPAVTSSRGVS